MAGRLDGRVVIITGGGYGIGRVYAHGMAREGARVLVADIDAKAGDLVAAELKTLGHDALAVRTDVADEASCRAMAQRAVDAWGEIDVLVNSAAIFATIPMSLELLKQAAPGVNRVAVSWQSGGLAARRNDAWFMRGRGGRDG